MSDGTATAVAAVGVLAFLLLLGLGGLLVDRHRRRVVGEGVVPAVVAADLPARPVPGRERAERVAREWVAEARVTRELRRRRRAQRWTVR
jgi:hypothetical protein